MLIEGSGCTGMVPPGRCWAIVISCLVMNSRVLRGTVSKSEQKLLEKCLTLLWADEAGRQLQHPEENLEHALAVSAGGQVLHALIPTEKPLEV